MNSSLCAFSTSLLVAFLSACGNTSEPTLESAVAEEIPAVVAPKEEAPTFRLGESFLAIETGMVPDDVAELYGEDFVAAELPGGEGTTYSGFKLFPGTEREVMIGPYLPTRYLSVILPKTATVYVEVETGLKIGNTLAELEKINGGPFTLAGFGWDYGGYVRDWQGGKLAHDGLISVQLGFGETPDPATLVDEIMGDHEIPSDLAALKDLPITVREIVLRY
ncbi:MAG: hypothetical protein AAFZ52_07705 [Bacteroidota bacterium]